MKKKKNLAAPSAITGQRILEQTLTKIAPLPSQRSYAEALASIFAMHIHRNELLDDGVSPDDLPASSALVVAPTGQGKTFLFRKMAETIGLNTIVIDCSTLAAEGWKGLSISNQLSICLDEVDDMEVFERSIILLDEFDKLHHWGTRQDQGNAMVNILQMFNNGKIALTGMGSTRNVSVNRFTILFGGAFAGLEDIIRERLYPKPKIGFSTEITEKPASNAALMEQATVDDLASYGMMRELLGRIGNILSIPQLQMEDFRLLLNANTGSIRKRYETFLSNLYGVQFEMTDAAVYHLAEQCMRSSTGARAATPLVDGYLRTAIAQVEADPEINRVILDGNASGCFVRYENGRRSYAYRSPARAMALDKLEWYKVKATDCQDLTNKLIRFYKEAGGREELISALGAFFMCSLKYLKEKLPEEEFTFESLEQLARATRREANQRSPFDSVMRGAYAIVGKEHARYDRLYASSTQKDLVSALNVIMEHVQEKRGVCRIRFDIPVRSDPIKRTI